MEKMTLNILWNIFSSTSPSYLIMASLDATNEVLDTTFKKSLSECIQRVDVLKKCFDSTWIYDFIW